MRVRVADVERGRVAGLCAVCFFARHLYTAFTIFPAPPYLPLPSRGLAGAALLLKLPLFFVGHTCRHGMLRWRLLQHIYGGQ